MVNMNTENTQNSFSNDTGNGTPEKSGRSTGQRVVIVVLAIVVVFLLFKSCLGGDSTAPPAPTNTVPTQTTENAPDGHTDSDEGTPENMDDPNGSEGDSDDDSDGGVETTPNDVGKILGEKYKDGKEKSKEFWEGFKSTK